MKPFLHELPDVKELFEIVANNVRELYSSEFERKSAIYFGQQPKFVDILRKISEYIEKL